MGNWKRLILETWTQKGLYPEMQPLYHPAKESNNNYWLVLRMDRKKRTERVERGFLCTEWRRLVEVEERAIWQKMQADEAPPPLIVNLI